MAGLLGDSFDDPRTQAVMSMAAGLLGGGNFGQALGRGLGGYQEVMKSAKDAERQKLADSMVQEQLQWKRDDRTQAQTQQAARQQALGKLQEAMGAGQVTGQELLKLGVPMDLIKEAMTIKDMGLPEIARTIDKEGPNGSKITQGYDKRGNPVGEGITAYTAPVQVSRGGSVDFVKPQAGVSLPMTMSPADQQRIAQGWASQGLARERFNFDKQGGAEADNGGKPQFNAELGGWAIAPNRNNPQGGFVPLPGNATGGAPKLTEDQAKAAGWLVQANNAWSNMQGAMKGDTGAEKPGLGDAIGSVPMMGAVGNFLTGANRQQFNQGTASLSEALLRAATGAGVNKEEAQQKIKELTPQFGDGSEVVQQKMNAIPLYIESLKLRSGKGAQQVAPLLQRSQPGGAPSGQLGSGSFVPSDISDLLKKY